MNGQTIEDIFDFKLLKSFIDSGNYDEEFFFSDQQLSAENIPIEEISSILGKQGITVTDERQALFELYAFLIENGHPLPDGSTRRCLTRIIPGCDPIHHDRSVHILNKMLAEDMFNWENSEWYNSLKNKKNGLFIKPLELLQDAICYAAEAGNLPALKAIISHYPSDENTRRELFIGDRSPLDSALQKGNTDCFEYLTQIIPVSYWFNRGGVYVQRNYPTVAAMNGQKEALKWLVKNGYDLNSRDAKTPLGTSNILSAVMDARKPSMVKLLLELGADPNVFHMDEKGPGPLHMAVFRGYGEQVRLLIDAKCELEKKDGSGMTPLLIAGMTGEAEMAIDLINAGADINATCASGRTAIHWAIANDRVEAFLALRDAGADMNIPDNDGKSPHESMGGKIQAWVEQTRYEQETGPAKKKTTTIPRL